MEIKDQFREGYTAGCEAYEQHSTRTPFWDRPIVYAVLIASARLTDGLLARHSSLDWVWRFAISIVVACLLAVPCSLFMDWLRKLSRR